MSVQEYSKSGVTIEEIAKNNNFATHIDAGFADYMDSVDELAKFRDEFHLPPNPHGPEKTIYLCGNSLGLQPKRLKSVVMGQLDKWSEQGVEGHFLEPTPWVDIDSIVSLSMSKLVGAKQSEVVIMNSLTTNLHLMMSAFYRPTASRNKIVIEKKAFPSDYHAVVSQIQLHGFDPKVSLVEIGPREGEVTLRQEDIEATIAEHGSSIALVLFSGIQYYTGQLFNMARIAEVSHSHGAIFGVDLAHAVGNVPLQLHDWNVDFAVWCSYKYMNCGPGSIGGCFVHERFGNGNAAPSEEAVQTDLPQVPSSQSADHLRFADVEPPQPLRLAGWWGHRYDDRFQMDPRFIPCQGVNGFRLSNPPVLLIACIRASLDVFDEAGIDRLRNKSLLLTRYLELLLQSELGDAVEVFTPVDPTQRGAQLSVSFKCCKPAPGSTEPPAVNIDAVLAGLNKAGVMCDARRPDVIRIAPAPLYNSFRDVFDVVLALKSVLASL